MSGNIDFQQLLLPPGAPDVMHHLKTDAHQCRYTYMHGHPQAGVTNMAV